MREALGTATGGGTETDAGRRLLAAACELRAARRVRAQPVDALDLGLEPLEIGAGQLLVGRLLEPQRVDLRAVAQHLVVQVGTGRAAGRADVADHLPLTDAPARADAFGEPGQMGVGRAVLAGVPDPDVLAVAAVALGNLDLAFAGGVDRRARSVRRKSTPWCMRL